MSVEVVRGEKNASLVGLNGGGDGTSSPNLQHKSGLTKLLKIHRG